MAGLSGKLEYAKEIKSPGNVYLEIFGSKKEDLPKICPEKLPKIELVEGNWGDVGCTLLAHYLSEGQTIISKEILVAFDKQNMSMTYEILEGELLKLYKSLRITIKATSEGAKNFMNWTVEYEKRNADVPNPDKMVEFGIEIANIVDEYYVKKISHAQA